VDANPPADADPVTALQWMVSRLLELTKHAAYRVDQLHEDELTIMTQFGPIDHHWVRLERQYREELGTLCVNVERVGLAERLVRLEEAKAHILVQAIQMAARDVGIPRAKVKELGPALRTHLSALQEGRVAA
jgi:hypothetical protein